jgi:hypothetical protein
MRSLESLMSLVGQPVIADGVQSVVSTDQLESSTEPDLEEGESPRSYLSSPGGGYALSHTDGRVNTLFVFLVATDAYQPFRGALPAGLSAASTRADVRRALGKPERYGEPQVLSGLGRKGAWDRYDRGSLCLHFEYTETGERVRQITIMTADTAP